MNEVMKFGNKKKISPRYIDSYKIVNMIGQVAYELEFPLELAVLHPIFHISLELAAVHPVFYISILNKCVDDPAFMVPLESVYNHSYQNLPVEIIDHHVRMLTNKKVSSIKFFWKSEFVEEATREAEATMKSNYTHLFSYKYTTTWDNNSSSVF